MQMLYGDVLAVWAPWTTRLTGGAIESGHHMAEEAPEQLADELIRFFTAPPGRLRRGAQERLEE